MGRKRKNVINKHLDKKCSSRYCKNIVSDMGTDNYCSKCRQAINYKNFLKRKGLYGGNYLYVYFMNKNNALYVGLTHNYVERHKEHLRGDKVFIKEDLWHKRVVHKYDDKLSQIELEYLEYALIQFYKKKQNMLTNKAKVDDNRNYSLIPKTRKHELIEMLKSEIIRNDIVDVNKNCDRVKSELVDINYLQNKKNSSCFGRHEELEKVIS